MTENTELHIQVASPAALLAVVPRLLGFTPQDSMVVIGTIEPRNRIKITLRYDLPDPGNTVNADDIAAHAAAIFYAQDITAVLAVGYGPAQQVTPATEALAATFRLASALSLPLTEALRVENGRYWSYVCTDEECCPAEGTPFSYPVTRQDEGALFDYPAAAFTTNEGPVLATRAALAATVAPVQGEEAESMRQATKREAERAVGMPNRAIEAALAATQRAISLYRSSAGLRVMQGLAAKVTVALQNLQVRDDAWARMDPEHKEANLRLWTDMTRLAQPGYVAAPASLLAFTAWQSGDGALANVALDRALADDPRYSLALLLRQAITAGAPPSMARPPMTPDEVAASYTEIEPGNADYDDGN